VLLWSSTRHRLRRAGKTGQGSLTVKNMSATAASAGGVLSAPLASPPGPRAPPDIVHRPLIIQYPKAGRSCSKTGALQFLERGRYPLEAEAGGRRTGKWYVSIHWLAYGFGHMRPWVVVMSAAVASAVASAAPAGLAYTVGSGYGRRVTGGHCLGSHPRQGRQYKQIECSATRCRSSMPLARGSLRQRKRPANGSSAQRVLGFGLRDQGLGLRAEGLAAAHCAHESGQ
jgi:hypothetical protein